MQVIEQQPGWGTTIGSALGEGLKNIANYKMQQLMERQNYKQQQDRGSEIWKNLGFPEQQAKALGSMPQGLQEKYMRFAAPQVMSNMQAGRQGGIQQAMASLQQPQQVPTQVKQQPMQMQAPQQQAPSIEQAPRARAQAQQQSVPQQQQQPPQQTIQQPSGKTKKLEFSPQIPKPTETALEEKAPTGTTSKPSIAKEKGSVEDIQDRVEKEKSVDTSNMTPKEKKHHENEAKKTSKDIQKNLKVQEKEVKDLTKSKEFKALPTPKIKKKFAEKIKDTEKDIKRTQKLAKGEKLTAAEKNEIKKTNSKIKTELLATAKTYQNTKARVEQQIELVNSGNMSYPTWKGVVDSLREGFSVYAFGTPVKLPSIDLTSWLTPETQEFEKLRAKNIIGASSVVGSKMAVQEVALYMDQFAKATQDDEVKVKLLNQQLKETDQNMARYNAMEKIIKESGGKDPENLGILIHEKSKDEIEKIEKEYKEGKRGIPYIPHKGTVSKIAGAIGGMRPEVTGPLKDFGVIE